MEKFKLFRIIDLMTFGLVSVIATFLVLYFQIAAKPSVEASVLMWVVALTFWGIYALFLRARAKWLKRIVFISKHNIAVVADEYKINQFEFEQLTSETVLAWEKATNWDGCAKSLEGLIVWFKPFPVYHRQYIKPLAGFLVGDVAVIGYKEPLNTTALAHEFGHKIHEKWSKKLDNQLSHEFMAKHGLS